MEAFDKYIVREHIVFEKSKRRLQMLWENVILLMYKNIKSTFVKLVQTLSLQVFCRAQGYRKTNDM